MLTKDLARRPLGTSDLSLYERQSASSFSLPIALNRLQFGEPRKKTSSIMTYIHSVALLRLPSFSRIAFVTLDAS
jgi:hypothetical protein